MSAVIVTHFSRGALCSPRRGLSDLQTVRTTDLQGEKYIYSCKLVKNWSGLAARQ